VNRAGIQRQRPGIGVARPQWPPAGQAGLKAAVGHDAGMAGQGQSPRQQPDANNPFHGVYLQIYYLTILKWEVQMKC